MDFNDLPPELGFLFMTIGQAAVSAYNHDMDKKMFVRFCEEMWNTMEINGADKFGQILAHKLVSDIDDRLGLGMHDALKKMSEK